jgi:hypothetical protein
MHSPSDLWTSRQEKRTSRLWSYNIPWPLCSLWWGENWPGGAPGTHRPTALFASRHIPRHRFLVGLCLELRLAQSAPTKDCTAAMGYCMTTHHDTGVIMSPQPPQDGRWATFVPASYKNMTLGEAQLPVPPPTRSRPQSQNNVPLCMTLFRNECDFSHATHSRRVDRALDALTLEVGHARIWLGGVALAGENEGLPLPCRSRR